MSIGLAPYVKGLLAMDDDPTQALPWLNLAEATLPVGYDVFLPRIRKDIRLAEALSANLPTVEIGIVTPEATPTALWAGTPIPTLTPSPTPRYQIRAGTPGSSTDAHVIDMSQGAETCRGSEPDESSLEMTLSSTLTASSPASPSTLDSVIDITYHISLSNNPWRRAPLCKSCFSRGTASPSSAPPTGERTGCMTCVRSAREAR